MRLPRGVELLVLFIDREGRKEKGYEGHARYMLGVLAKM